MSTSAGPAPLVLETPRLLMTPLGSTRADELAALYADPEVTRFLGPGPWDDAAVREQCHRFERIWSDRGWGQSAVVEKASGLMIGRVGLHDWPAWGEVELGYVLARSAQGRGLATEASHAWLGWAAAHLDVDHLIAVIHPENAASIRMASRLGFTLDRRDITPQGVPALIYRRDT
ncbi:GNAT family N-acetyltransferase [Intrasporangium sp.]|uniref:GNAT family N-acetyltransferase n=1 Tax=Intrasporangium sp. TaxID=1925024 RepID=UPI0029399588|nr:GNAT family N-acetyltransferase [Intrasporangium sp.]MDV3222439.1 GNAT family N-acetyltransferase [Intrasporangium sp.]